MFFTYINDLFETASIIETAGSILKRIRKKGRKGERKGGREGEREKLKKALQKGMSIKLIDLIPLHSCSQGALLSEKS